MSEVLHEADDIPEFLRLIAQFTDLWFSNEPTWGPWFRGEADANRPLRPKVTEIRSPHETSVFSTTSYGRNLWFERRVSVPSVL
jgi:hypothetical protein